MRDLLAAEVLKLRTTRTSWALLAATVAVSALAVASAVIVGADSTALDLESDRGVRTVLNTMANGAIFVLVLGIIIAAGEFRHGTATDTFLTTPRRSRVIAAKLTVAAVAGVAFGALAAGVSMAAADVTYRLQGLTFPIESADVWLTLGGAVLYATLFGAIGAATGSLVRNQVLAIVGWLAWIFVAEHIAIGFVSDVGRWLPMTAGLGLVRAPRDDLLSQSTAAVVLLVYGAAILTVAMVSERYRDA